MDDKKTINNEDEFLEEDKMKKKGKFKSFMQEWASIIIFVIIIIFLKKYVFEIAKVDGSSMEPLLQNNDVLVIDKLSYHFNEPERGDVIVIPFNDGSAKKTLFIKRIIGLPNETISFDEEYRLIVNGEHVEEDFTFEIDNRNIGDREYPIVLADDEYFVMGDNRNNSFDGRNEDVGNVLEGEIVGKAAIRLLPLSKEHKLDE